MESPDRRPKPVWMLVNDSGLPAEFCYSKEYAEQMALGRHVVKYVPAPAPKRKEKRRAKKK